MLQTIRRNLNATSLVAVVALVFAMSGGAYAASKYLITSTKQINPKVLKSLQGKAGPVGAAGPAGSQGPGGAPGTKGETGPEGKQGAEGKEGPAGPAGKAGAAGKNGSPWTAGGVLPSGATETGVYEDTPSPNEAGGWELAPISFPVPLEKGIEEGHAVFVTPGQIEHKEVPSNCENTEHEGEASINNPEAKPGYLCVFQITLIHMEAIGVVTPGITGEGTGPEGGLAVYELEKGQTEGRAEGSWAVTAP